MLEWIWRRTPLAWLQLTFQTSRLVAAIAGVMFAVVLMLVQFGFQDSLFDSATLLQQKIKGDLVMLNARGESIFISKSFSRRTLLQTLNHKDVKIVTPLYIGGAQWKNPWTRKERSILIFGFEPREALFDLPGVAENLSTMKSGNAVLFDRSSRSEFGNVAERFEGGETISAEINRKQVFVKGLFTFGATFASDGTLMTSDLNFFRIFPDRKEDAIELGVIDVQDGANISEVRDELLRIVPPGDVKIYTKTEFIAAEKKYWGESTAIGFIFNLGVVMGFVVGVIIAYQILQSDVANHLSEYATLKAMGYTNWYLVGIVFQESIILSVLGYIPGILVSFVVFEIASSATFMPMEISLYRGAMIFVLTLVMCFASGVLAMRKLRQADPADIF